MSQLSTPQRTERVSALYQQQQQIVFERTDRNFAWLMIAQYVFAVICAVWISPLTWQGAVFDYHVHVWAALLLGGVIASLPVFLGLTYPGRTLTRHVIAVAQMAMGGLLIHLTGGRIETHFHVFGSLAFLAFYRDWRVLLTATLVVAADHCVRGIFWPKSVFGAADTGSWRWLEHVGWVLFEDLFLLISIRQSVQENWKLAQRQSDLEAAKFEVESERDRFFDLSVDMLCVANLDGHFKRVNPMFSVILGYEPSELIARPFLEFIHPDDQQSTQRAMEKLQHGGHVLDFENRYRCRDGEYRWLSWSTRAPAPGESVLYAVARDVTTRKKQELALKRARAAAEQANRAKSEFLANMSHEIRTPLNAVIGMTELVLETELNATQKEYLQTVLDSGESLLTIINEILDFSKIEAGHVKLECLPFSLSDMLGDTLKSLAIRAHANDLELACRIAPQVPDRLRGDVTRLRQVLVNLVGNAIKFTPAGEIVVDVDLRKPASDSVELMVSVRDTGIGIPNEQRQKIFEAFTQADMSTTRKFGGTGLGLSICSTLVRLMGGRIWVESEEGQGSTFYFTVPLQRALESDWPAPLDSRPADVAGMRVLVVDDNATNRRILEEMLRNWRALPVVARDVPEALALLNPPTGDRSPFDLVISDLQMPGQDGLDLVRQMRDTPEHAETPVILLSSGFQADDFTRCREFNIGQPLLKPVKNSDLRQAVASAVAGNAAQAVSQAPVAVQPPAGLEQTLKILFVEDGVVNQRLGQRLLEKWGHAVTVANNGREAVEKATTEDFDVVLMDVRMPVMDGLEATREIRKHEAPTDRHLPILALTAHALKGDREVCLQAGMDGYVSKPFRKDELFEAIRKALTDDRPAPSGSPPPP